MILPSKHVRFSESLFALGGVILRLIDGPTTVDEIWEQYSIINKSRKLLPAHHNFENIVLALNVLFLIGAVSLDHNGNIKRDHETN